MYYVLCILYQKNQKKKPWSGDHQSHIDRYESTNRAPTDQSLYRRGDLLTNPVYITIQHIFNTTQHSNISRFVLRSYYFKSKIVSVKTFLIYLVCIHCKSIIMLSDSLEDLYDLMGEDITPDDVSSQKIDISKYLQFPSNNKHDNDLSMYLNNPSNDNTNNDDNELCTPLAFEDAYNIPILDELFIPSPPPTNTPHSTSVPVQCTSVNDPTPSSSTRPSSPPPPPPPPSPPSPPPAPTPTPTPHHPSNTHITTPDDTATTTTAATTLNAPTKMSARPKIHRAHIKHHYPSYNIKSRSNTQSISCPCTNHFTWELIPNSNIAFLQRKRPDTISQIIFSDIETTTFTEAFWKGIDQFRIDTTGTPHSRVNTPDFALAVYQQHHPTCFKNSSRYTLSSIKQFFTYLDRTKNNDELPSFCRCKQSPSNILNSIAASTNNPSHLCDICFTCLQAQLDHKMFRLEGIATLFSSQIHYSYKVSMQFTPSTFLDDTVFQGSALFVAPIYNKRKLHGGNNAYLYTWNTQKVHDYYTKCNPRNVCNICKRPGNAYDHFTCSDCRAIVIL